MPSAFLTSKKQDYATPWPLVEAIEAKIGKRFTLDVCASEKSAKAPKFYTETDDAFKQNWALDAQGGAAWCNPEYGSGKILEWLLEAVKFSNPTNYTQTPLTTVFLLPANKVDQHWWHDVVVPCFQVWTVRGRVDFLDPETGEVPKVWRPDDPIGGTGKWVKQTNPQASLIVIVGPEFPPCAPVSFKWR